MTHFFAIRELSVAQSRHLRDDARLPEYMEMVLVDTEPPPPPPPASSLGHAPGAMLAPPSSAAGNIFFSTAVWMGGGLMGPWPDDCWDSDDELFDRVRLNWCKSADCSDFFSGDPSLT